MCEKDEIRIKGLFIKYIFDDLMILIVLTALDF